MSLKDEFRKMVNELAAKFTLPSIANIFFPPFYEGGQPTSENAILSAVRLSIIIISFNLKKINPKLSKLLSVKNYVLSRESINSQR
jgi:hypothetical protein